jgi:hypothetical protein
VGNIIQPWLPKLQRVRVVEKKRKIPQPQVRRFRPIKKYELLHRPFDLRFRGRINKWLVQQIKTKGLEIKDRFAELYFFPQGPNNEWLTQKELAKELKLTSIYGIRKRLVNYLLEIWEKEKEKGRKGL